MRPLDRIRREIAIQKEVKSEETSIAEVATTIAIDAECSIETIVKEQLVNTVENLDAVPEEPTVSEIPSKKISKKK